MIVGHMRKDARTSYLGYENVLHGCRLGVYRFKYDEDEGFFIERTMKKKNDKDQPPYLKFELFLWFTGGNQQNEKQKQDK